MKTAELSGAQLDAWVAKAEGIGSDTRMRAVAIACEAMGYKPSSDWSQGGPIIERERISIIGEHWNDEWLAALNVETGHHERFEHPRIAATPLVAAMRAYVASKFGDTVPDEQAA